MRRRDGRCSNWGAARRRIHRLVIPLLVAGKPPDAAIPRSCEMGDAPYPTRRSINWLEMSEMLTAAARETRPRSDAQQTEGNPAGDSAAAICDSKYLHQLPGVRRNTAGDAAAASCDSKCAHRWRHLGGRVPNLPRRHHAGLNLTWMRVTIAILIPG